MNKNTIPNIWTAQEKLLHLYKVALFAVCSLALILTVFLIMSYFRSPFVILSKNHEVEFYPTQAISIPIEKPEIERFTKLFLTRLYVWNEFNAEKIEKLISPFTDGILSEKVVASQNQKYSKELAGKKLSQSLAFVDVSVLPDRIICKFDRILKIEGIPLIIPTEVTFLLTQGEPTELNPMGIYIGGIKESENAK